MNDSRTHDSLAPRENRWRRPPVVDSLRAEALFQAARDPVILYNLRDRCVVEWNPAAEQMFGYTREEALDLRIEDLLPEYLRAEIIQVLDVFVDGRSEVGAEYQGDTLELPALHKSGREMFVQFSTTPLGDPSSFQVMTIVRDLTERRQLEAERERLLAASQEHAERVSELARLREDFMAMIAHELVAPVSSIRGLADLLGRDAMSPDQQRQMVSMIRSEADLLQRLVDDVRDAARIERDAFDVNPALVPAAKLIEDAAAAARPSLADHRFVVEPPPDVDVLVDGDRVLQVLRNLLTNAAKHTPPGTTVTLRARQVDDQVVFEVEDEGPGIGTEDLMRIFEKFGRGRDTEGRRVPGVGLGLYLSRRIALAHGGDLRVVSEPGKGSMFSFVLKETGS